MFSAQRPLSESAKSIGPFPQKNVHMHLQYSLLYTTPVAFSDFGSPPMDYVGQGGTFLKVPSP